MNCYNCGAIIEPSHERCPRCRRDQSIYRRILLASDICYNNGLALARVRNLTGAIEELNRSVKFNKRNTQARNLLGLVYNERGETILAMREWVISKNLQPENNLADDYITKLNKGTLKKLDSAAQKFNQCLAHSRDGSRDLSKIQLRRVIGKNSNLIPAYQLLALIQMRDGEYESAKRTLKNALAIDKGDPITLEYLSHLKNVREELPKRKVINTKKESETFMEGNETIIMPRRSLFETFDNTRSGIINILAGILLGVMTSVFLIVPTLQQNANTDAQSALVTANKEKQNQESNVQNLEEQVKKLSKKLDKYEGKSDIKGSYENLLAALEAYNKKDLDTASELFASVNRDLLDDTGKSSYDDLAVVMAEKQLKDDYEAGYSAFRSGNYEEAVKYLESVLKSDDDYEDGNVTYYLAQCYDRLGDMAKAKKYYESFTSRHPGTQRARAANSYLKRIEREEEAAAEAQEREAENYAGTETIEDD